jgi:hypothetical protein
VPNELAQSMEPISPELVLVDPELAQRARARLPDSGHVNGGAAGLRPDSISPAEAAPPARRGGPPPAVRPRFLVVAVGVLVVSFGVLIWSALSGDDSAPPSRSTAGGEPQPAPALPSARQGGSSAPRPVRTPPQIQRKGERAGRVGGRAAAMPRARPRRSKAPATSKEPSAPLKTRPAARRTPPPVPTRLFVWLPRRGAGYYNVRFFKGARMIYEAWPTDPRVTVPMRGTFRGNKFEFTNGRYRWIVRPAFGPRPQPRYGEPIVRSVWVVP